MSVRKVNVATLLADITFDMRQASSSIASIDAMAHDKALADLEMSLTGARKQLRQFFTEVAKQKLPPTMRLTPPKIKQTRYHVRMPLK